MTSDYPTSVETRSTIPDVPNWRGDATLLSLETWGQWVTDAIVALEAKLGADSSSVATAVDKLVSDIDTVVDAIGVLASVEVDHAASSPVTILAAAAAARHVLIIVSGTEAATTGPDIDIGETDTVAKFVEDFAAGAWEVGHGVVVAGTLTADKALIATIATAGDSGKLQVTVLGLPDLTPE